MKKDNLKRTFALVAGSLVVALIVSILPGGFFVSAAEVSKSEARRIALKELGELEYIDKDSKTSVVIVEKKHNEDVKPFYTVIITKDNEIQYELKIDANSEEGNVLEIKEIDLKTSKEKVIIEEKASIEIEDEKEKNEKITFKEFDDFKNEVDDDYLKDNKYIEEYNKPTAEASLNMLLKDGKKAAIADFKENKDDDKEAAKKAFKDAKDELKEIKKLETAEIEEVKKDEKNIVETKSLNEKQVLLVTLEKAKVKITEDALKKLDDIKTPYSKNNYKALENLFDIEHLSIEVDDDNPPAFEIEFIYNGVKYEFTIHSLTGKILDFDKEKVEENNEEDDDDYYDNKNKGSKDNKEKSNKGKVKNK